MAYDIAMVLSERDWFMSNKLALNEAQLALFVAMDIGAINVYWITCMGNHAIVWP
jgi:hypothetical protein